MAIPTTVAHNMGQGLYGRRSAAGLNSSTGRQFATGMLVAHVSCFYIKPGTYRLVTRAFMLPVGSINIFVSLTDAIDNFNDSAHHVRMTPLLIQAEYDQARSATLPLSGRGTVDGSINNTDESDALIDDADTTDPPLATDPSWPHRSTAPSLARPLTGAVRTTRSPCPTRNPSLRARLIRL
jgi:hypothetical protein